MSRISGFVLACAAAAWAFGAAAEEMSRKVNINEASVEDIESLPSVAAFEAEAIVHYREKHGPYESVEDLKKVPDVSPRTVENIRGELTTGGEIPGSRRPQ